MANLILPDPRMEMPELLEPGRKPIGPVVAIDDLQSAGLAAYIIYDHEGLIAVDVSGRNRSIVVVGTPTRSAGGVIFDAIGEHITIDLPATTDATVLHFVKPQSTTNNGYLSDFAGENEFAIIVGYQDGFYNAYGFPYPISNNPTNSRMAIGGGVDGVLYTKTGSNIRGYTNGQKIINGSITGGDFSPSGDLRVGTAWLGTDSAFSTFYTTMVFDRGLPDGLCRQLSRFPYYGLIPA